MSGCYGSSPEDRYFEGKLFQYLDGLDVGTEEKREELYRKKISDLEYLKEALFEMDGHAELLEALLLPADEASSIRIGDVLRGLLEKYAMPTDDEVMEELREAHE